MLRRLAFMAAIVLLLAAALLFTALNRQVFEIDVGFAEFEVTSGLALLISFAAGLLGGALWRSIWIAQLLGERGRLRHALRLAEARGSPNLPTAAAPPDAG
jgi:uncharacterized integral membrane protein